MAKRKAQVKIKNCGVDFKLRAVQLSSQPGVLVKDVTDSLDIHPQESNEVWLGDVT